MEKTNISIIVPFYNGNKFLEYFSLPSIISQTYGNYEVLIIDDGSEENPEGIIKKFQSNYPTLKLRYIRNKINKGLGAVYNLGIKLSKYDYLAFLEQDDIWLPNKLEEQVNFMISNNLLFCNSLGFSFNLNKRIFLDIMKGGFSSIVVKKEIFRLIGFFDEDKNLLGMQDAELGFKIFLAIYEGKIKKEEFKTIEKPLFIFTRHPKSLSAKTQNFSKMVSRYKSIINKFQLYENIKDKELRKIFKFWYSHLAFNLMLLKDRRNAFFYLKRPLKFGLDLKILALIALIWFPVPILFFLYNLYKLIFFIKGKINIILKIPKFFKEYKLAREIINKL